MSLSPGALQRAEGGGGTRRPRVLLPSPPSANQQDGDEEQNLYGTGVKHEARTSLYGGFKDPRSPVLQEIEEKYHVHLFWRFKIKWVNIRDISLRTIFLHSNKQ